MILALNLLCDDDVRKSSRILLLKIILSSFFLLDMLRLLGVFHAVLTTITNEQTREIVQQKMIITRSHFT